MPVFPEIRYSLKTFLLAVAAVALFVGYQLNWIRQRRAGLQDERVFESHLVNGGYPAAPFFLSLFGERGVAGLDEKHNWRKPDERLSRDEKRRLERLFPEAIIFWND